MYTEDLVLIANNAPFAAAHSATSVLKLLASDGDLPAILALSRMVASELGLPNDTPGLRQSASVAELLAATDTASILRVYALGFVSQEFLAHIESAEGLAGGALEESTFARFQALVRRGSLLQHEALKAYVLCGLALYWRFTLTFSGLDLVVCGMAQGILDRVLRQSRVVSGDNSDKTFAFGYDLICAAPTAQRFMGVVAHEMEHDYQDEWLLLPYSDHAMEVADSEHPEAGSAPLTYATAPDRAYDVGVCALIRGEPESVDQQGRAALLWTAVRCADPEAVRRVLQMGVPQRALLTDGGVQAARVGRSLCVSSEDAHKVYRGPEVSDILEVLSLLRSAGVDLGDALDDRGTTLLSGAAAAGNLELTRFLLAQGVGADGVDKHGETALLRVAILGAPREVVLELLSAGAEVDVRGADGGTALHRAVTRDDVDLAKLLLDRGASVGVANLDSREPLFGARSAAIAAALCDAGADPNAAGPDRRTALMRSAEASLPGVVRELLAHDADVDAADASGGTALHWAALAKPGQECGETVDILLAAGAFLDERTSEGATPVAIAAAWGHTDTVRRLIAAGADVEIADENGDTPLLLALKLDSEDRTAACRYLLAAGADVAHVNSAGESALSLSAQAGMPEELREVIASNNIPGGGDL